MMAHFFTPLRDLAHLSAPGSSHRNVGIAGRAGSAIAGAALGSVGLIRRDGFGWLMLAAGGALLYRGVSGNCALYRLLGWSSASAKEGRGVPGDEGVRVEKEIGVSRAAKDLYDFWRDLTNLPGIMPHIKSVTVSGTRSHWVVEGPGGGDVEWDAEFINDKPGELIAWQSLPGAEVRHAGSVRFDAMGGGWTRVKVALEYLPPGGRAGAFVAHLFGAAPDQQLEEDLLRFKSEMESRPSL